MDTGISNCKHIPDGEMSSSKAVDLHLRPAGSFQQTSTISAHSIRISARGRCMPFLSAGPADRISRQKQRFSRRHGGFRTGSRLRPACSRWRSVVSASKWHDFDPRVALTPRITLRCQAPGQRVREGIHPLPENGLGCHERALVPDQEQAPRYRARAANNNGSERCWLMTARPHWPVE